MPADKLRRKMGVSRKLIIVAMLLGLLALLLSTSVAANDEKVIFPDPNLKAVIREAVGKSASEIYQSDLEGIIRLSAPNRVIADLTGLEYCTNLTQLNLTDNKISDISPLSDLANISILVLERNQISDLSPLANLTELTHLGLAGNQISDISPR